MDDLPSSLTHEPRIYSKLLTEKDLAKQREHNKEKECSKKKDYKENGHHKECEERERQSTNRIKPDPQLLLQALTPTPWDVRILVQAEEELSQTKVRNFLYDFLRHHF